MGKLQIWFLDVGHGDCAYIQLPNGGRMMIDCGGGGNSWPSRMLKYYKVTKDQSPVPIPEIKSNYGIDNLVITHPHGDHLSDITSIYDDIGFYLLTGGYRDFIDKIGIDKIDYKKRGQDAAIKFVEIVKEHSGDYVLSRDRVAASAPECIVTKKRFISYEDNVDLNDISWLVSLEIGGRKVLFSGDLTAAGVNRILTSNRADEFKLFVKGTTIIKVPHHGRENGCSKEMFDAFGAKPLLCILSDEILNERNEGTSNTQWYTNNTSDTKVSIDGTMQNRKVLTTRQSKDIYLEIDSDGTMGVTTDCFASVRDTILST